MDLGHEVLYVAAWERTNRQIKQSHCVWWEGRTGGGGGGWVRGGLEVARLPLSGTCLWTWARSPGCSCLGKDRSINKATAGCVVGGGTDGRRGGWNSRGRYTTELACGHWARSPGFSCLGENRSAEKAITVCVGRRGEKG